MIPIYQPYLTEKSIKYAEQALRSNWLSHKGPFVEKTTNKLKEMLGVNHVLLLNNGTAGCHLLARIIRKFYPNINEIVCPNHVYVAAWNGFIQENFPLAIENTDQWTLLREEYGNFDDGQCILIVHNVGNIVNVPKLQRDNPKLIIVEDACEAFGGTYEGKPAGSASLASVFSFYSNKTITQGEGGALVTNREDVYEYAKLLHGQGMGKVQYIHDDLGYNYRTTNVAAAILLGQLEDYSIISERKSEIFSYYKKEFGKLNYITFPHITDDTTPANWIFTLRLINNPSYHNLQNYLHDHMIEIRPMFYSIERHPHTHNFISNINRDIALDDKIANEFFMIPSYPDLDRATQDHIIKTIQEYAKEYKLDK